MVRFDYFVELIFTVWFMALLVSGNKLSDEILTIYFNLYTVTPLRLKRDSSAAETTAPDRDDISLISPLDCNGTF